jgi:ADP-heptose:LPS heptosyltransferase
MAPMPAKHRIDIWSNYIGIELTNRNMYLNIISEEQIKTTKSNLLDNGKINILFNPFAYDKLRSLLPEQIKEFIKYLKTKGNVFAIVQNKHLESFGIKCFQESGVNWLSYIHAADCVITVDTSIFHYAGGIKKPLTGIFTHVDGKKRGEYYQFELVQKHRDNGDWTCGPCYNFSNCNHPKSKGKGYFTPKPCVTELTVAEMIDGAERMFKRWSLC